MKGVRSNLGLNFEEGGNLTDFLSKSSNEILRNEKDQIVSYA